MSKQTDSFSIRKALENVFAGLVSAAIIAFVAGGTVAMCLPAAAMA